MRRKKLGLYGITLVVLAGLFQLITLSLDQLVIQLEEKNRVINDKISKNSYEQQFYLESNRKIGEILRDSSFRSIIVTSTNFGKDNEIYENYFKYQSYHSVLKRNNLLLRDIFSNESIRINLCGKKFRDIINRDQIQFMSDEILDDDICKRYDMIILAINGWLIYLNNNEVEDLKFPKVLELVDYNEYYLDFLLKYFGSMEDKKIENLKDLNNNQYEINQNKQLYLLFSMVSQLLSFLFLLLLFRRILK